MNTKKCGWLFLSMLLLEFVSTGLIILLSDKISIGIIGSLIYSQLIVLIPAILFLIFSKEKLSLFIPMKKPKIGTSLLVIVLTYLCMPLIMTANAVSMLFVDNEVVALSGYLANVPAWQVILMVGILGPVSEEFVFRGVFYHGFKKGGNYFGAMLISALLFGLTHLNFNQMSYAIIVGIIGVLLVEGCGSIFYSMLLHICINTTNAIQIITAGNDKVSDLSNSKAVIEQSFGMPYKQALCVLISVLAFVALISTVLAGCLFWAIVKKENRQKEVMAILTSSIAAPDEKQKRIFSIPLIIAIVLCILYMIIDVVLAG